MTFSFLIFILLLIMQQQVALSFHKTGKKYSYVEKNLKYSNQRNKNTQNSLISLTLTPLDVSDGDVDDRKELWKTISSLEKQAVDILSTGDDSRSKEAFQILCNSILLKEKDPFLKLAHEYAVANDKHDLVECESLLTQMKTVGLPPHLAKISQRKSTLNINMDNFEEVDPGSTFSDTVTEKVRVKVSSYYDSDKSDPINGKYMFWYKVAIYNEGPEPVQIVARMWEIEKCLGEKEIVRGSGIMSTQPIIAPGDVFTYQSVCPLKVFPPRYVFFLFMSFILIFF